MDTKESMKGKGDGSVVELMRSTHEVLFYSQYLHKKKQTMKESMKQCS